MKQHGHAAKKAKKTQLAKDASGEKQQGEEVIDESIEADRGEDDTQANYSKTMRRKRKREVDKESQEDLSDNTFEFNIKPQDSANFSCARKRNREEEESLGNTVADENFSVFTESPNGKQNEEQSLIGNGKNFKRIKEESLLKSKGQTGSNKPEDIGSVKKLAEPIKLPAKDEVNMEAQYGTDDITDYINLKIKKSGDFEERTSTPGEQRKTLPEKYLLKYKNKEADFILFTSAVDTVAAGYPIDYYLDKSRQPKNDLAIALDQLSPKLEQLKQAKEASLIEILVNTFKQKDKAFCQYLLGKLKECAFDCRRVKDEIDKLNRDQDNRDVFDEFMPRLLEKGIGTAKILFPYNMTNIHWLTGEIIIKKERNAYEIEVYAHDPYGLGEIWKNNFDTIEAAIRRRIREEHNKYGQPEGIVRCVANKVSPYNRRQTAGDTVSCGVIAIEDIIKRIRGEPLNRVTPYPKGARELREMHLRYIKNNLQEKDRTRENFISRNTKITVARIPKPKVPLLPVVTAREVMNIINSIENAMLKERIVEAFLDEKLYKARDSSYTILIKTAIEQAPLELLSNAGAAKKIKENDINAVNKLFKLLFDKEGQLKSDEDFLYSVSLILPISHSSPSDGAEAVYRNISGLVELNKLNLNLHYRRTESLDSQPTQDSEWLGLEESSIGIIESETEIIRDFYKEAIHTFAGERLGQMKQKVQFIVVGHLVPTLPFYLEALNYIGDIAVVIPKSSVPDDKVVAWLNKTKIVQDDRIFLPNTFESYKRSLGEARRKNIRTRYDKLSKRERELYELPKEELEIEKIGVRGLIALDSTDFIKEHTESDKEVIIMDIGGYFAPHLSTLVNAKNASNIIGFVEDTENGHRRYQDMLDMFIKQKFQVSHLPTINSVARSLIKDSEDYNVGKAITDAVDHILRVSHYTHLAESKTILIIGYGKIGEAAAKVASEKTKGTILICETDSVRKLKASAHSFRVVNIIEGLKQAHVIMSCTGHHALTGEHFLHLQSGVCIASCTSAGDEFHQSFLSRLNLPIKSTGEETSGVAKKLESYVVGNKVVNLLNGGNSVNFIEKAVHGYFIHGVLASLAISAINIFMRHKELQVGHINDFNSIKLPPHVKETGGTLGSEATCQSVISGMLMRHKLRTEATVTNHESDNNRYIPRGNELGKLKRILRSGKIACITGNMQYGQLQVAEQFCSLNSSRYDIVWRFKVDIPLEKQFELLARKINDAIDQEKIVASRIETGAQMTFSAKVMHFLEKYAIPYLLVFEGIIDNPPYGVKHILRYIPQSKVVARGDIIFTASSTSFLVLDKLTSQQKKPRINGRKLEELRLDNVSLQHLLEYYINDDSFYQQYSKDLQQLLRYLSQEETEDINRGELANILQLLACWIAKERARADFSIRKDVMEKIDPSGSLRLPPIKQVLKVFVDSLSSEAKNLLSLFYVFDQHKSGFFLPCINVEEVAGSLFGSISSKMIIAELVSSGFIEKNHDLYVAYSGKYVRDFIKSSSLGEKEALRIVIKAIVKKFCNYEKSDLPHTYVLWAAEQIANLIMKAPDGSFYKNWSKINQPLVCKLFKRLACYYESNTIFGKAIEYYYYASKLQEESFGLEHYSVAKIQESLGNIYAIFMNHGDTIKCYEKALTIYEKNDSNFDAIRIKSFLVAPYSFDSRFKEAEAFGKLALNEFQKMKLREAEALAWANLGTHWNNKKDFAESERCFNQAQQIYRKLQIKQPAKIVHAYGTLKSNTAKYGEAIKLFQEALVVSEQNLGALYSDFAEAMTLHEISLINKKLYRYDDALKQSQDALKIIIEMGGDKYHSTISRSLYKAAANFLYTIGQIYLARNEYDKAIIFHSQSLKKRREIYGGKPHANIIESLCTIGNIHNISGKYSEAHKYYSEAILLDPNNPEHLYARAKVSFRLKDYKAVENDCRDAIKKNPKNPNYYNLRGASLKMRGFKDLAAQDFANVDTLTRGMPNSYRKMASLYFVRGEIDLALKAIGGSIEHSIKSNLPYADDHYLRAKIYLSKKSYFKALEDCLKALAMDASFWKKNNMREVLKQAVKAIMPASLQLITTNTSEKLLRSAISMTPELLVENWVSQVKHLNLSECPTQVSSAPKGGNFNFERDGVYPVRLALSSLENVFSIRYALNNALNSRLISVCWPSSVNNQGLKNIIDLIMGYISNEYLMPNQYNSLTTVLPTSSHIRD